MKFYENRIIGKNLIKYGIEYGLTKNETVEIDDICDREVDELYNKFLEREKDADRRGD